MDVPIEADPLIEQVERTIADIVMERNGYLTLKETDELCVYNHGHYLRGKGKPSSENEVMAILRAEINEISKRVLIPVKEGFKPYGATISKRNQVIEIVKTEKFCSLREFDVDINRICVDNGHLLFDPTGKTILPNPLTKDGHYTNKHELVTTYWSYVDHFNYNQNPYKTFIQFPLTYDVDAKCPVIEKFLIDVFGIERLEWIYEIIGYCLMPTVKFGKAWVLYGPPLAGKTTFLQLLTVFIASKDVFEHDKKIADIPIEDMNKRFQKAELRDKILLIRDELNESIIKNTSTFRTVVTNMYLSAEVKGIQKHVKWLNRMKQFYACNKLFIMPKGLGDEDWRRWSVISCYVVFKDVGKMTEEDKNDPNVKPKDPNLFEKMINPKELSGLLNKALEGWVRLETRGHFDKKFDDLETVKSIWLIDINPVKVFVDNCCEIDRLAKIDYLVFFTKLNEYRVNNNAKPIGKTAMTQHLKDVMGIDNLKQLKKKVNKVANPNSCGYNFVGLTIKPEFLKDIKKNPQKEISVDDLLKKDEDIDEVGNTF